MLAALKTRDYRLLWIGQGVSQLGDQFHLIALPWLVLTLTRDPLHLGLVFAVAGIPRAAVMVFGGALADRHSPRTIMLVSDAMRFVVAGAIAASVITGVVQLWMVYALALTFGLVSGVFLPAAQASLPRLLGDRQLEAGNALMMGVSQFAQFVGPALAGTIIALLGTSRVAGDESGSLTGVGMAFGIDALSFAISALTLVLMHPLPALDAGAGSHPLAAIADGLRFTMARSAFRWLFVLLAAVNFLVVGPLFVGVPVLAQSRFAQGAAAFGLLMSAFGAGNLCGMIVAGLVSRLSSRAFSTLVLALFAGFGVVIAALAFISSVWVGAALLVVLGVGNGYVAVTIMTVVQRATPAQMLGRVMSLVILAELGVTPIATTFSGAIVGLGATALFVGCGAGMFVLTAVAAACRRSWSLDAFETSGCLAADTA